MSTVYDYDLRGVRVFVNYASHNGGWRVECRRKKTPEESKGEHDWKMIMEIHFPIYWSRQIAETKALEFAEEICKKYGF